MPDPTPDDLKRWRKQRGATQKQAASLLGVSRQTWSRMERGERQPTQHEAAAINVLRNLDGT